MRWIFFLLVLGNLMLLAYFWQQQPAASAPAVHELKVQRADQRLRLVSEARAVLSPRTQAALPVKPKPRLCQVAGPFSEQQLLQDAQARATALGIRSRVKRIEAQTDTQREYWVHVPPRSSRAEARKILRQLQAQRIDSYIIGQGDLADGVSLGLFRNQSSAENLQARVKEMGIAVAIRVVSDSEQELWLELEGNDLAPDLLQRISAGMDAVRWQPLACSSAQ
ncbi:hypothetical protein GCM10011297_06200 [Bacterioplanes sanyensis]|uniref:SPOR domain-containing protein n=1 Tax=Bacterioplanes sanyensis TaxID=1249553 RepID=UPI0016738A8C|nr:SPOR domain-containing protein [Bacterioplanes sanyensis]GGY35931.1 hypothetical protein GCM10011297_06200 [Bacterioplanes sanyensis]